MPQSDDLYIRKDVFDARMDRLEALMRENNTRLEANINNITTELRGEIKVLSERVNQNFAYLNMRIDSISTYVGWGFAIMAIFVALLGSMITFAPSNWGFMKRRNKPSVTRKEVENIVDKYLGKIANIQK